jgi:hypothetical protein
MGSQRHPATRESPEQQGVDEGRLMIERAERAWRQQVRKEEAGISAGPNAGFRWLLLGVALSAIVLLLFQRLGQLG